MTQYVKREEMGFWTWWALKILSLFGSERKVGTTEQQMDFLELLILKRDDIDKFAKQLLIAFLRESKNLTQALYLPYYCQKSDYAEYNSILMSLEILNTPLKHETFNRNSRLLNKPLEHETFNQIMARLGSDYEFAAVNNSYGFTLRLGPVQECKAWKMFNMSYSEVRNINVTYPSDPVVSFVDFFIFDSSFKIENSRRKFKLSCKKTERISVPEELIRDFSRGLSVKIFIDESWGFKIGDEFCWMIDQIYGRAKVVENENGICTIKNIGQLMEGENGKKK